MKMRGYRSFGRLEVGIDINQWMVGVSVYRGVHLHLFPIRLSVLSFYPWEALKYYAITLTRPTTNEDRRAGKTGKQVTETMSISCWKKDLGKHVKKLKNYDGHLWDVVRIDRVKKKPVML